MRLGVTVGVLVIELFIPESGSLKSKRYAVRSIKDRLKNRFNVSVAELDYADKWQRALIGVAAIANESKLIESMLNKALELVYGDRRVEVIDSKIEYY